MLSRHSTRLSLLISTALALALSAPGCALQEEGERCSLDNGDADCVEGLICKPGSELAAQSDICCKPNNASEHPACIPGAGTTSSSSASTTSTSSAGGAGGMGGAGGSTGTAGTGGAGGSGGTGG